MSADGIDSELAPAGERSSPVADASRLTACILGMLVGGAMLLGGLILHFAEKAGKVQLIGFPIAGRLTAVLGLAVFGAAATFAGRRAAIAVCIFLIIGGIVTYVVGLIYVEQFGNRICQAIGLLTTLVGLVAIYAVYGMDES
jgi:hypothetical protein